MLSSLGGFLIKYCDERDLREGKEPESAVLYTNLNDFRYRSPRVVILLLLFFYILYRLQYDFLTIYTLYRLTLENGNFWKTLKIVIVERLITIVYTFLIFIHYEKLE